MLGTTKYSDNGGDTEAHDQHLLHLKISTGDILIVIGKQPSWKAGQPPPSPPKLLNDTCCCRCRCGVRQYGKFHLLFQSKELRRSADIDDVQPHTSDPLACSVNKPWLCTSHSEASSVSGHRKSSKIRPGYHGFGGLAIGKPHDVIVYPPARTHVHVGVGESRWVSFLCCCFFFFFRNYRNRLATNCALF